MRNWTTSLFALGLGLFVAGAALPAAAQNQPQDNQNNNNNNGNNGGRRNRGNFDPAQMRAQFMERIKEQLGAKDDEWSAIEPRLQKVMDVQRETRGSRGGFSRRGGQDNNQRQSDRPESEVSKAQAELRTALENKDTPPAELAAKLKALRDARDKARGNLAQAQKELKDLLTQRQEAVLVNMGILD